MANSIDCEVLGKLLESDPGFQIVHASVNRFRIREQLQEARPHVLLADPKCEPDSVAQVIELVLASLVQRAIVLDERIREALVAGILPFPQVSYLTRQAGSRMLLDGIRRVVQGERVFDPAIAPRIARTSRGWQLQPAPGQPSIAALTSRELEILKLLAAGRSVRDCAQHLHLSESTIDNHKTRLMKKLHIHKLTELTHVAIRDGLITV
jgi:DNA-binding NarL/FixJ family response regulator